MAGLEKELADTKPKVARIAGLEKELADAKARAARVAGLEKELADAKARAARIAGLEKELADAKARAARITALEKDLAEAKALGGRVKGLEQEVQRAQTRAGRVPGLEQELAAAKADAKKAAAEAAKLSERDAQLRAAQTEVRTLTARVSSTETAAGKAAKSAETSASDLRRRLAAAEKSAALVPDRDKTIIELQRRLAAAEKAGKAKKSEKAPAKPKKKAGKRSWQKGTTKLGTPGADHVDDLKVISGIGPVMEKTLQSFGIQTWEQIADFNKGDIDKVTEAIDAFPGRIERDDWVGGAKKLLAQGHKPGEGGKPKKSSKKKAAKAEKAAPKKAAGPKKVTKWRSGTTKLGTAGAGHTDDLKVVNGIGPVMEKTLNGFGIQTWEQLAAFSKADVTKVNDAIDSFPGRIERDNWVSQAADLMKRFPLHSPYDRPTRKTMLNEG